MINYVILAAGQGKRMRSALPKALQPLAGRPLLARVLDTVASLPEDGPVVVVVGHRAELVRQAVADRPGVRCVLQEPQRGTADALRQALPLLDPAAGLTLVLYADVPLIGVGTLRRLLGGAGPGVALLTASLPQPFGYGRIIRADGRVTAVVEERDASDEQKKINEINTGVMALPTDRLAGWLDQVRPINDQGEYYLTDLIALAVRDGVPVSSTEPDHDYEIEGVNSKGQLARLEGIWRAETARRLTEAGVTLLDPARLDVRGRLDCGRDVSIDVGCVFEGEVRLGDGAQIGPYCVIRDSEIGAGARVEAFSHLERASVGAGAAVGPYARLRPGAELAETARVGNFVEIKNSRVGAGSKINHLSYVGDATVGQRVNIGAGVITCNYDGAAKHRTVIGDDAFIGSDTQLVAPVTVGDGATLGAGTTLTRDAPAQTLTLSRAEQRSVPGWRRPIKAGSGS